jgi:DNA-binding SARP family transcriptional activator
VIQAPRLIAEGRWQTLQAWLERLPDDRVQETPWLVYWWGVSLLAVNQIDARRLLERSHALMHAADDIIGQLLSAAGVIDSHHFQWASFTEMDRWIAVIQTLLDSRPAFDSIEAELHVNSSLLIALSYRQPGNPLLSRCVSRVTELLDTEIDANQRVTAGTFLLGYCYFSAEYGLAKRVIATIEPLLAYADVTPLNRLWWRARVGYYDYQIADYPGAVRALDEAASILLSHGLAGLHSAEPMLAFFRTLVALGSRDLPAAEQSVAMLRRLANPQRRMDMWYLQFAESVLAVLGNDPAGSLDLARASIRPAAEMGMTYVHEFSLTLTAHVLAHMGRDDDALQTAGEAKALVEGTVIHNMAAEAMFLESYIALRRGDRLAAVESARAAFEASRRTHYAFWFRFVPEVLPEVCALAFSEGIEPAYVGEVIKRYAIEPPRPFVRHWPWPLQICTLGAFAIAKAGVPIQLTKSVTRKPMELLKAIIALGVEGVSVATLIDQLWPDAEGDAAQKTFAITLHRLRGQLGDDHAIVMKAGTVSIDQRLCWVDVGAFERLTREGVAAGAPNIQSVQSLRAAIDDLKALYRGPLMPNEVSPPWILAPRQRLHTRFLATVSKWGAALDDLGDPEGAIALYQHALEIDGCAEPIYQRLMRCYEHAGRLTDVVEVYRLCCDALKAAGHPGSSAETEALYRSLRSRAPSTTRTRVL